MTNKPILESIIEFVNSKEKTKEIDTENKNKFAEYRKKFKESHPHYYKMYYQKQKNPQLEND